MRHCCDWWGWSMQKLEPIERLNIGRPNMVKQGLMYLKQSWKWMLTRLWKNANIGLATPKNRTGTSAVGGRAHNHHATYQWCVRNYSYFYIPVRDEDAVKLSSKEIDKNGRENQAKTRWVRSGRQWKSHGMWEAWMVRKSPVTRWKISKAAARCNERWLLLYTFHLYNDIYIYNFLLL